MRMRSRPEISRPTTEKSGAVSRMIHAIDISSAIRMNIAASRPVRRARGWLSRGSLLERIEMKMTLSTPRTISRNVSVTSARRPADVKKASIYCGLKLRARYASRTG